MYCRNNTGTLSRVLCREVYYAVSLFGRVHHQRFFCTYIITYCICVKCEVCGPILIGSIFLY